MNETRDTLLKLALVCLLCIGLATVIALLIKNLS